MSAPLTGSPDAPSLGLADALRVLESRGYIKQSTDRDALQRHFAAGPVAFYVGFDPTGESLHVGHLLPIMAMAWLQKAGHRPVIVHGGGTAMIGDPSGKDKTRDILTPEKIAHHLVRQRPQFGRFLDVAPPGEAPVGAQAILRDNADWLLPLNYIQFLRDIGQHFSVNRMLSAESARLRLERNQGLSFIEFNYHLLQSYDFLVLHRAHGCTLQLGGDDQWFNILGGVDLIRREAGAEAHALTVPLLSTADGKKMGKTESGAVWLDPDLLSPFDYYQYWVNVVDADVGRFLRLYTFLPDDEISALEALQGADLRRAKQVLAREATTLAHGAAAAEAAEAAAAALFGGQGAGDAAPTCAVAFPLPAVDALVAAGLATSKGEARRLIQGGGVRYDAGDGKAAIGVDAVLSGPGVLWKGKKDPVRLTPA